MTEFDPETVATWRAQGLSDAEIGRRLGVSAERLAELAGAAGAGPDDNRPNDAETR